jgi:hypothetical protein
MKKQDVLFYTFLSIFALAAVITLLGILECVKIKSGYLNALVSIFVVELAGAVIALFKKANFVSDEEPCNIKEPIPRQALLSALPAKIPKTKVHPQRAEATPAHSSLSSVEYFTKFHALSDRFHEREELAKQFDGNIVRWIGTVNSVSTSSLNGSIQIQLKVADDFPFDIFHACVPDELRTKAYALQKGDLVAVTGVLKTSFMPYCPNIDSGFFELITENVLAPGEQSSANKS